MPLMIVARRSIFVLYSEGSNRRRKGRPQGQRGPPEGSTKAVVSIGSNQSHEKCGKNLAVQRRKIMKLGILIAGAALPLMLAGNGSLAQDIKHFHPKGELPSETLKRTKSC